MSNSIILPRRGRGHQSAAARAEYTAHLDTFCRAILEINSTLDFQVSARGWCYLLEEYGLLKGDFGRAQNLIVECRNRGLLPLNIVAEDSAREFQGLEDLDEISPEDQANAIIDWARFAHLDYTPVSFWEDQAFYLQMLVEKIDLRNLFHPICYRFKVPISNARGWSDLNSRAALMRRFAQHEAEGRQGVLLYCGDHDPAGLHISEALRSNLEELGDAVGWRPDDLIINRFGLNHDFIEQQGLTWIDNLETGSGRRLDEPRHPDHSKPYVQEYLSKFGARKVEANALVVRSEAGRQLCLDAICQYVDESAPETYSAGLQPLRDEMQSVVTRLMQEEGT